MPQECVRTLCPLSGCHGWHTSLQLREHETAVKSVQARIDRYGEALGSAWARVVLFSQLLPFAFWKLHFLLCWESKEMRHRRVSGPGVCAPASTPCLPTLSLPCPCPFSLFEAGMPDNPDLLPVSQPCGILYPSSPSLSISVQSDEKAVFSQNSPSVLRDCCVLPRG